MACPVVDLAPAHRVAGAVSPPPRLAWLTEPATRWIGKVHIPAPSPFGAAGADTQLARLLSPGMVLLSRTRLHLGNLLIPGYWKHAAIYTLDGSSVGSGRVVEATVERGVAERSLADFIRDKHDLAILRPRLSPWALRRLADEAVQRIGAAYDFGFVDDDNGHYYCSKLVFDCLRAVLGREPFAPPRRWGRRLVTAHDLYEQRGWFAVVLNLASGPDAALHIPRPRCLPLQRLRSTPARQ
jgi:hypothetical protein